MEYVCPESLHAYLLLNGRKNVFNYPSATIYIQIEISKRNSIYDNIAYISTFNQPYFLTGSKILFSKNDLGDQICPIIMEDKFDSNLYSTAIQLLVSTVSIPDTNIFLQSSLGYHVKHLIII